MTPDERDPELEPAEEAPDPAGGTSDPAAGTLDPAGRTPDAAGRTPDPAGETPDLDDAAVADLLVAARAFPAPGFRGELGRHLRAEDPGHRPRPRFLWPVALLWIALGALVLVYGLLQSLGKL